MRKLISENFEKTQDASLIENYLWNDDGVHKGIYDIMVDDFIKANKERLLAIAKERESEELSQQRHVRK